MNLKKTLNKIQKKRSHQIRDRIKIKPIHGIKFLVKDLLLPIVNISQTGLGVLAHPNFELEVGQKIQGLVQVKETSCQIEVEVVHITGQMVGCRLLNAGEDYKVFLEEYFESELAGVNLEEVDSKKLSPDPNGEPHWYFSDSNHEIYFTIKNEMVVSLEVTYQNYVVVVDSKGQLYCGVIWVADSDKDIEPKSSDLVKGAAPIPEDIKHHLIRFIGGVQSISKDYRNQIEKILTSKMLGS